MSNHHYVAAGTDALSKLAETRDEICPWQDLYLSRALSFPQSLQCPVPVQQLENCHHLLQREREGENMGENETQRESLAQPHK